MGQIGTLVGNQTGVSCIYRRNSSLQRGCTSSRPTSILSPRKGLRDALPPNKFERLGCRALGKGEQSSGSGILVLVEQSQRTLRSVYINAFPGPWAWFPSYLVPFSAALSIYGAANGHRLLQNLAALEAPKWIPMAQTLQQTYTANQRVCDVGFDTLLSTICTLLIFLGLPAMDLLLGADPKTPQEAERHHDGVYKGILHSHVLLHWSLLLLCCSTVSRLDIHPITLLGLVTSMGCCGALIFTVAHELLHSPSRLDKAVASASLLPLAYMHWVPSHIAHHRNVGKIDDATTARLGEPLYRFIPRSIIGNIKDGIDSELTRLRAKHLPVYSLSNRVLQWAGGPLCLLSAIYSLWGPQAAALGVGQAAFAILMLEDVNYIEHYGLRRRKLASGGYERTSIAHSWNANWIFTNSIIFSVQRHSDHHAHAYKPYQKLEDLAGAPQLPASYPVMMMLALFPGLFFDVMDPKALQALGKSSS